MIHVSINRNSSFLCDAQIYHMHKSLFDFLSNKKEAGPFLVDAQRGHKLIAMQLFKEIMMSPAGLAVGANFGAKVCAGGAGR